VADKQTGASILFSTPIIFGLLGYFVYGETLAGALGMAILAIVLDISLAIALIPFAGVFIQFAVNLLFIIPNILGLTGLWDTWLVTVLFILATVVGAILTLFTTSMVLG
jgi:hypothetical protein